MKRATPAAEHDDDAKKAKSSHGVAHIGINGFGRIGRLVCRIALQRKNVQVVGINDPFLDPPTMKYLFVHDSVHGKFQGTVETTADSLIVNGVEIKVFAHRDPGQIPWGAVGATYIVESTGVMTDLQRTQPHLNAGAKKVIITAPSV